MSFKTFVSKSVMSLRKHSPAIFTGIGVVGLGATAYYAYKSRDKVEAVVEEIERKRDLDLPISKVEVAKDITEAIYKPVVVGAISITCILLAQKIQNNRIKVLVGTLAVEQARNLYFEKKYRKQHGDEAYNRFITPVDEEERRSIGENGEEVITVEQVKVEIDKSIGQWFEDSSEHFSDDHDYNMQFIESVNQRMQTLLFARGHVTLNEVLDNLGFDRLRNGALLGWSSRDSFEIITNVSNHRNEKTGELEPQIWVTWSSARYIHEEIEYNGRYSIHG